MVKVYGPLKKYQRRSKLKPSKVTFRNDLVQRVKQLERSRDMKHRDVDIGQDVGSSGYIVMLDNLSQGTTDLTRIGDSIKEQSITIRADVRLNDSNNETDTVRCMLVLDKEGRGAAPGIGDIIDLAYSRYVAPKLVDNNKRFVILRDKTYSLTAGGLGCTKIKWYIPFNKRKWITRYSGNVGTDADFKENHLYFIAVGRDNTNKSRVDGVSRIWYTDA